MATGQDMSKAGGARKDLLCCILGDASTGARKCDPAEGLGSLCYCAEGSLYANLPQSCADTEAQ